MGRPKTTEDDQGRPNKGERGPSELVLVLDRIEGTIAILVDDRGGDITVPLARLPFTPAPAEGDVIRVPVDPSHRPLWARAWIDREETERRKAEGREILDELKRRDPGGDVKL